MKRPLNHKKQEQGQSLVEFALTLPILILLLSGLLDFGRAFYTYVALEEAVAEAALYLAISPDCPAVSSTEDKCDDPNNALYRANNQGNAEFEATLAEWNIPWTVAKESEQYPVGSGNLRWDNPFPQDCDSIGCTVLIQVEYPFELITPGMNRFVNQRTGANIILRTQALQIIVFDRR